MSPNTQPVYDVAPVEEVLETEIVEQPTEQPAPKKKSFLTRFVGLILLAICALPLFMSINYVHHSSAESATLLAIVKDLFASEYKLFGILPVLTQSKILACGMYALLAGVAVGMVCGLIALITGKTCALRVGTYFASAGAFSYAVSVYTFKDTQELFVFAIAAVAFLFYLILSFNARGKKAFGALLNFICSAVVTLALVLCGAKLQATFNAGVSVIGLDASAKLVRWALLGIACLSALYSAIRMQTEKGLGFDRFRCVVMLIISLLFLVLGLIGKEANDTYTIAAAVAVVISLLQTLVLSKKLKKAKGIDEEPVEDVVEEIVEAVEEEFIREEFAEATPYEGGPVEGVAVAEEVNPTFTDRDPLPEVRTAGYDFYNCKSFDPFIAILNNEERNQFTELFILKYKGVMPEIPEYIVGGDNKEFFRKLFIYLGQYRDRIPDGLLSKIYQFAIKLQ